MSNEAVIGIDIFTMNVELPLHYAFSFHHAYRITNLTMDVVEFERNNLGMARYSLDLPYSGSHTAKLKRIAFYGDDSTCAVRDFWDMLRGEPNCHIDSRILWNTGKVDKMIIKNHDRIYETTNENTFQYLATKLSNRSTVAQGKYGDFIVMMKNYFGINDFIGSPIERAMSLRVWKGNETESEIREFIQNAVNFMVFNGVSK